MSQTDQRRTGSESLSARGQRASSGAVRPDREVYFDALKNLYHPTENPEGVLVMNVAENHLVWGELKGKIETITSTSAIPDWVAKYTMAQGNPEVRQVIASFMAKHLTGCEVDHERLALTAGASAAIDLASFVLADEGDVVVIPAPSYPVYTHDVGARSGLRRYDLQTHHELDLIGDGPLLTAVDLDAALHDITERGDRMSLLILTTPDNPTGGVYSREQLEEISDWCINHQVHLLVNEIYGLSIIDTNHPNLSSDYTSHREFESFVRIIEGRDSDYLHYCYAFSKDFGISGFRFGCLYSRNTGFVAAIGNLNLAHLTSNHTQWVLQEVLRDDDYVARHIATNRERLTAAYSTVVDTLRESDIPYVPSRGGLFVWIDMSEFLRSDSQEGADDLWLDIYEETRVLLTPGRGFGHTKNGLFRVLYSGLSAAELEVAMNRLAKYASQRRSSDT